MALRAVEFGALETRLVGLLLVQDEEDCALPLVEGDHFDLLSFMHLADIDVVVEYSARGCSGEIFGYWKLVFENTSVCELTGMPSSCSTDFR